MRQLALFAVMSGMLAVVSRQSIWGSYGFRYSMFNPQLGAPDQPITWNDVATNSQVVNQLVSIGREYHLLPEAYLFGFAHTMCHSQGRKRDS